MKQYKIARHELKEALISLAELEQQGKIEKITNPVTNTPMQCVPKPNKTVRLVFNFKALNRLTTSHKGSYIDLNMALTEMKIDKFKTCLDLANGFYAVPLAEESKARTAFTPDKTQSYQFCSIPHGYLNSPNVFQECMGKIL